MWSDHTLQSSHLMPIAHLLLFGDVFHSLSQVLDILPSDRGISLPIYSHLSSPNCISASLGGNPCLTSPAFTLRAGVLVLAVSCTVSPQNWHGSILSPTTLRPDIPNPSFQASPSLQPYIQREEGTLPPSSSKDPGWPDLCHVSIPGPVLWFNRCSI